MRALSNSLALPANSSIDQFLQMSIAKQRSTKIFKVSLGCFKVAVRQWRLKTIAWAIRQKWKFAGSLRKARGGHGPETSGYEAIATTGDGLNIARIGGVRFDFLAQTANELGQAVIADALFVDSVLAPDGADEIILFAHFT